MRLVKQLAAPDGGYVISFSNSIHPGSNPKKVIVMFRAADNMAIIIYSPLKTLILEAPHSKVGSNIDC
jgi:hypothetical protein